MCIQHASGHSRRADLRHEAKVQDADLAFRGADEVARVGVGMQEACLQQLDEVTVQQRRAQLPYVTCCALAQLLTCADTQTGCICTLCLSQLQQANQIYNWFIDSISLTLSVHCMKMQF